jgi:hypothetical protein
VALLDNRRKIGDETTDTWEELLAAVETMPKRSKCVPLTSLDDRRNIGGKIIDTWKKNQRRLQDSWISWCFGGCLTSVKQVSRID